MLLVQTCMQDCHNTLFEIAVEPLRRFTVGDWDLLSWQVQVQLAIPISNVLFVKSHCIVYIVCAYSNIEAQHSKSKEKLCSRLHAPAFYIWQSLQSNAETVNGPICIHQKYGRCWPSLGSCWIASEGKQGQAGKSWRIPAINMPSIAREDVWKVRDKARRGERRAARDITSTLFVKTQGRKMIIPAAPGMLNFYRMLLMVARELGKKQSNVKYNVRRAWTSVRSINIVSKTSSAAPNLLTT